MDSADAALEMAESLPGLAWAKIGPMVFLDGGPRVIGTLKDMGVRVFLDLKWHDIPNSVAGAACAAARAGVDLATVHALGGPEMISAAREACGDMKLVAVTVLTSHSPDGFWSVLGRSGGADLGSEVRRLAVMAVDAGAHGLVCSPHEIREIREIAGPDGWVVVPGIRPAGAALDDQRRTAGPALATTEGATHLVVGRPITRAKSPAQVYDSIRRETEVSR
jgi:orotidine-5'-phosphate decarboxylase